MIENFYLIDDSLLHEFKLTMAAHHRQAEPSLLTWGIFEIIDIKLLLQYLFGYQVVGKVYETKLHTLDDPNQYLRAIIQYGYNLIQDVRPDTIRPEGIIQFWFYDVPESAVAKDESHERRTDNERFKALHVYDDSEDEDETKEEPSEVITVILMVKCAHTESHKLPRIATIEPSGEPTKEYLYPMVQGISRIIDGDTPYSFSPFQHPGRIGYIKIMFPCIPKSKAD
jgi:hypothetical protein